MMIQIPHALGAGLFALSLICPQPDAPEAPNAPEAPYIPACADEVVLMPSYDWDLNCDMNPPQILAYRMDDPGPIQIEQCHDAGGRVLDDPVYMTSYCIDLDY